MNHFKFKHSKMAKSQIVKTNLVIPVDFYGFLQKEKHNMTIAFLRCLW